jgi:hypothetical protein
MRFTDQVRPAVQLTEQIRGMLDRARQVSRFRVATDEAQQAKPKSPVEKWPDIVAQRATLAVTPLLPELREEITSTLPKLQEGITSTLQVIRDWVAPAPPPVDALFPLRLSVLEAPSSLEPVASPPVTPSAEILPPQRYRMLKDYVRQHRDKYVQGPGESKQQLYERIAQDAVDAGVPHAHWTTARDCMLDRTNKE